jgi:Holliday junction DNA helicase RuvB
LEIDHIGLDRVDRTMLKVIIERHGGGPVGVETIAASTGEDRQTIEDVYEPYLLQIGLLQRTPQGRCVTDFAYKHLQLTRKDE